MHRLPHEVLPHEVLPEEHGTTARHSGKRLPHEEIMERLAAIEEALLRMEAKLR